MTRMVAIHLDQHVIVLFLPTSGVRYLRSNMVSRLREHRTGATPGNETEALPVIVGKGKHIEYTHV